MDTKILFDLLKEEFWNPGNYPSVEELEQELNHPEWEESSKVHDWRNYVPETIQSNWNDLLNETQMIVWFICNNVADNEEWD